MNKSNKKSRKANPEFIKKGQAERLQEFFISKNFRSRNAFAEAIGVSSSSINEVIWGYKLISKNLFSRIKRKFPDADENWLLNGEKGEPVSNTRVAEDQQDYNRNEEARLIQQQSKLIDQQRDTIDQLIRQIEILKGER
ncbi:MAG TPA: hypothetical protein VHO46_06935 [Bacteroidales bacterium]|nr:hypothetical protein [Bacteroidales bacterium]